MTANLPKQTKRTIPIVGLTLVVIGAVSIFKDYIPNYILSFTLVAIGVGMIVRRVS